MTPVRASRARRALVPVAALLVALMACGPARAQAPAPDQPERKALRVCQDPNNLPFSNTAAEGIENRIAELFGRELGLPVTYYSFPQRMAFIRNTLRYKLPGADFPCDIVMGVPVGFDQVSVTRPYYRSTYALVFPRGRGLDGVTAASDLQALEPAQRERLRIGVFDRSPASDWLVRHQLVAQGVPYQMLNADPQQYPGEIIEKELVAGRIDAAIVWGPIAGFYARRSPVPMTVLPMASEPGVRFDYQMAMGVRYGEREWKQQVEAIIERRQAEIHAILTEFGVPLVAEPAQVAAQR